jgi:hypothetical protein
LSSRAELFGHTDTRVTVVHDIQSRELVNPVTAALLDRAFKGGGTRAECGAATVAAPFHLRFDAAVDQVRDACGREWRLLEHKHEMPMYRIRTLIAYGGPFAR